MPEQWQKRIGVLSVCVLLCGCAIKPTDPDELAAYYQNNDPLEPMNRAVFSFNQVADEYVMAPVVRGYRNVVPSPVREGADNFFTNLKQPVYLVNSVLQGDFKAAGQVGGRFVVNTFLGFFGLYDTASELDMPIVKRDFGQTLAVWGVKDSGPYVMLPILGPSTVRDTIGMGVDAFADPVDWVLYEHDPWLAWGRAGANGFIALDHSRDLMDDMKKNSTDYYATMRSMYQQNRQKEINHVRGEAQETQAAYDFDFPDDEDE
ncbi:MAG: VacJ family lipoprotein [Alphaproteobacteria bacterium]|nr:VacJ family lipoprotein [Alphaproteobacteria bacterium]